MKKIPLIVSYTLLTTSKYILAPDLRNNYVVNWLHLIKMKKAYFDLSKSVAIVGKSN